MSTLTTICPQEIRIKGRRKGLNKIWATKEHKAKVKMFCGGKTCQWCGTDQDLLAHHPFIESYKGVYTDLELSGCIVLCKRCHFSLHKGYILCQVCKKYFHRPGAEMCKRCYLENHPEVVQAREKFVRELKAKQKEARRMAQQKRNTRHPCKKNLKSQRCREKGVCPFSPRKAIKCRSFKRIEQLEGR
jgi:hypothetical protein